MAHLNVERPRDDIFEYDNYESSKHSTDEKEVRQPVLR